MMEELMYGVILIAKMVALLNAPPLIVSEKDIDGFIKALDEVL